MPKKAKKLPRGLKRKEKPLRQSGGAVLVSMFSEFLLRKAIANKYAEEADTYPVNLPLSSGRKRGREASEASTESELSSPKRPRTQVSALTPVSHSNKRKRKDDILSVGQEVAPEESPATKRQCLRSAPSSDPSSHQPKSLMTDFIAVAPEPENQKVVRKVLARRSAVVADKRKEKQNRGKA